MFSIRIIFTSISARRICCGTVGRLPSTVSGNDVPPFVAPFIHTPTSNASCLVVAGERASERTSERAGLVLPTAKGANALAREGEKGEEEIAAEQRNRTGVFKREGAGQATRVVMDLCSRGRSVSCCGESRLWVDSFKSTQILASRFKNKRKISTEISASPRVRQVDFSFEWNQKAYVQFCATQKHNFSR